MATILKTARTPLRRTLIAVAAGLGLAGLAQGAQAQSIDTADRAAIESVVRAYLLENPEIITEALKVLEEREQIAELERQRAALAAQHDEIFYSASPEMGNPSGDVLHATPPRPLSRFPS